MIQDIQPHVYDNQYRFRQPSAGDPVLFGAKSGVYCRMEGEQLRFPTYAESGEIGGPYHYLFSIDETPYFLGLGQEPEGYAYEGTQICRTPTNRDAGFAGVTASQLAQWYRDGRFCGRCGHETVHDEKERMLRCPACGSMNYPRISPAVIVAVTDGDRILLTRYSDRPSKGNALIAGFTEIGESVEQTVHREVLEEVGLRVKDLVFYKSQPWSFSGCLLMGFFCKLDGSSHVTLQEDELAEGNWIPRSELRVEPDNVSLTNEMICLFREGREPK